MTSPNDPAIHSARDHSSWALAGVVLAYVAISSSAQWYFAGHEESSLSGIMLGLLVFQPIMLGIWTALGTGSILIRIPIVIPCLMLLFVAPGYVPEAYKQMQLGEFVAAVLTGYGIYAISTILFLLFRRYTHFRIRSANEAPTGNPPTFNFSIKYLLALVTIYAVVLGMMSQLRFQTEPPSGRIFGPSFFIFLIVIGGAVASAAVLPTTAAPLSILHGSITRRAVAQAFVFWAVVTGAIVVFTIDLEDPSVMGFILLTQFGSTIAGVLAAKLLRGSGLRLVRDCPLREITKPIGRPPISI